MSFIKSYGISLPNYRIEDNILFTGGRKGNFKSICFADEDIITMAFDAAEQALKENADNIDAVFFATNTPVLKDCYHSTFIADLLGINKNVFCLDFIGTDRCGTDALIIANELINSGKYNNILIIAADTGFSSIGDEFAGTNGHSACAVLLSNNNGIAQIENCFNIGSAISEKFIYKNNSIRLDARYSIDAGFKTNMTEVSARISNLKEKTEKIILNSKYSKIAGSVFSKAGFSENQFSKDSIAGNLGNTGVVSAFLQLISEIENKTNSIILIDYTNGSNVFFIKNLKTGNENSLSKKLQTFESIISYHDYLKLRKEGNFNSVKYKTKDIFSSEMMNEREKNSFVRMNALKCKKCSTAYFIKTERCKNCKSNEFENVKLSKTGKVFSLTREHYFPVSFQPLTMLVIDLDGGGRVTVQQTDCMYAEKNNVEIGSKVKLVLRKMMERDSKPNYFLKAIVER